tara:strand:+ start:19792 stop:20010 length:219 start_codon:yes stop_codon:yes gene_type:complete
MNLTPSIRGNNLALYDTTNGSIHKTIALPPGSYSNVIMSGDRVSVTITPSYGLGSIRTFSVKTGALISDIRV